MQNLSLLNIKVFNDKIYKNKLGNYQYFKERVIEHHDEYIQILNSLCLNIV
jgi:hypothetical protein